MGFITAIDTGMPTPLPELHLYWQGLCGDRAMPARPDVDPLDIPRLLPHVFLVGVESPASRLRFRFRLVGTRGVGAYGREFTNRCLDDLMEPADYAIARRSFERVVSERQPDYREEPFRRCSGQTGRVYRLLLPLSTDGQTVDMLLGGALYSLFPGALFPEGPLPVT